MAAIKVKNKIHVANFVFIGKKRLFIMSAYYKSKFQNIYQVYWYTDHMVRNFNYLEIPGKILFNTTSLTLGFFS